MKNLLCLKFNFQHKFAISRCFFSRNILSTQLKFGTLVQSHVSDFFKMFAFWVRRIYLEKLAKFRNSNLKNRNKSTKQLKRKRGHGFWPQCVVNKLIATENNGIPLNAREKRVIFEKTGDNFFHLKKTEKELFFYLSEYIKCFSKSVDWVSVRPQL